MFWLILIIAIILVFLWINAERNSPLEKARKLEELENIAYERYTEGLQSIEERIEDLENMIKRSPKKLTSENIYTQELKELKERSKKIKEMQDKYTRLKERYKHTEWDKRVNIFNDWQDYTAQVVRIYHVLYKHERAYGDPERQYEREKEARIIMEEIERRFDNLLKE